MAGLIRLIFLGWLALELLAFALAVREVGALYTLMLVILASMAGVLVLRGEGLLLATRLARFIQHARRTGEVPPLPLADSLPRFAAGALLLIPGFANDALALLVLLPPLRGWLVRRVQRWIVERHHAVLRQRARGIDIEAAILPEEDEDEKDEDGGSPPSMPEFGGRPRLPPP